jgi:mitogen-activated protein kinase organizer 1
LRLWNPHSGLHVKTYTGPHNYEINDAVIAEDNSKFISCGGDKQFFQWDVTSGQVIRKFVGHDRKVNALCYGPREELVVSASHDKTVRVWDLRSRSREAISVLDDAVDSVLCLGVAGDEIATGSTDGCVRRYDVRKGQRIEDQLQHPVGSISFSKDHRCVLASTLDDCIYLIDADTGCELASYRGHRNKHFKVQSMLDPSNAFVVSGSEDHRVCFWDLAGGDMFASVAGHDAQVLCARFQGDTLVTAAANGSIKVWEVSGASRRAQKSGSALVSNAPNVAPAASGQSLPITFGKKQPAARSQGGLGTGAVMKLDASVTAQIETEAPSETMDSAPPKRKDRGRKGKRKDPPDGS